MSDSMDDLLRKNEENARRQAEGKRSAQEEKARVDAIEFRGRNAIRHDLLKRVGNVVEEFNQRSSAGHILLQESGPVGSLEFTLILPNTNTHLTLSGSVDPVRNSVKVQGKVCRGITATLSIGRGQGVHFLLLEDDKSGDNPEWWVVRVRHNPVASRSGPPRQQPFIVRLDEIERASAALHVIVPEFSKDIEGAVVEMIGHGLSSR